MEEAMAQPDRYDILVLGSGTGGKLVAWQMASAGRQTAVVERKWIGGSCPNIACMPSKNEISSARVAHLVRHAAEYGWTLEPGAIDMAVVRRRKRDMVAALNPSAAIAHAPHSQKIPMMVARNRNFIIWFAHAVVL